MSVENAPIKVRYKFDNDDEYGDLICELTEFMDGFLLDEKLNYTYYRTYLYNDIGAYSTLGCLQIIFRVPRCNKRRNNSQKA